MNNQDSNKIAKCCDNCEEAVYIGEGDFFCLIKKRIRY